MLEMQSKTTTPGQPRARILAAPSRNQPHIYQKTILIAPIVDILLQAALRPLLPSDRQN